MLTVDTADRFYGDMTIVLDGGLNITITNDLLVTPDQYVEDSGAIVANSSAQEVLIQPTSDVALPLLGRQFFAKAYLFVDYDSAEGTLWAASETSDTNLVSGGNKCSPPAKATTKAGRPEIERRKQIVCWWYCRRGGGIRLRCSSDCSRSDHVVYTL